MQNPYFRFLEHLVKEVDIPKISSTNERNNISGEPSPAFFEGEHFS